MCRITDVDLDACLLCRTSGTRKCPHEIAVCSNQVIHPLWKVYYYKNSGSIFTFQGCGFCKNAEKAGITTPAKAIADNPGWPGCCYPPVPRNYHWIPPADWPFVAAYHKMEIPLNVQTALDNMNAQKSKQHKKGASDRLTIDVPNSRMIQQPVPIPKSNGYIGARSYSPSAIHISPLDRTSPRSSTSSKDSNSSGSPPSSTTGSRRGYDMDGSDRSNSFPTMMARSGSQEDPRMVIRSSSSQSRRSGSPVDRLNRGEPVNGKRRSNSDPKHQPSPPSAYERLKEREPVQSKGRDSPTQIREKDKESPTQTRFRASSSAASSNHPYSNPHSSASSSMKKLPQVDPTPTPRPPMPAPVPRARQTNAPSITSVMAGMSLDPVSNTTVLNGPTATTLARIQLENAGKRGVIPPHVRKAGSVISASSGSSSSTNSSAREGTVISDGAFTDYLSDDSDFDLQRQAEIDAENAYQEALRKHEEMEFKEARDSLTRTQNFPEALSGGGYPRRAAPMMSSAGSRIRV